MEKLEKVEVIREKCGVSYEDAKAALDACDDNVLDAIIWLEKQGKSTKQTANYTTEPAAQSDVSPEMQLKLPTKNQARSLISQRICLLFGKSARSSSIRV